MAANGRKKLKKLLQEEKRQRRYAERDAKMWCDVVLEQEDDLQRKDIIIADLEQENREKQREIKSVLAISYAFQKRNIGLETELREYKSEAESLEKQLTELEAPKAWINGEPTQMIDNELMTKAFTSEARQTFNSGIASGDITFKDKVICENSNGKYRVWQSYERDGHYFDGFAAQGAKEGEQFKFLVSGNVDLLEEIKS